MAAQPEIILFEKREEIAAHRLQAQRQRHAGVGRGKLHDLEAVDAAPASAGQPRGIEPVAAHQDHPEAAGGLAVDRAQGPVHIADRAAQRADHHVDQRAIGRVARAARPFPPFAEIAHGIAQHDLAGKLLVEDRARRQRLLRRRLRVAPDLADNPVDARDRIGRRRKRIVVEDGVAEILADPRDLRADRRGPDRGDLENPVGHDIVEHVLGRQHDEPDAEQGIDPLHRLPVERDLAAIAAGAQIFPPLGRAVDAHIRALGQRAEQRARPRLPVDPEIAQPQRILRRQLFEPAEEALALWCVVIKPDMRRPAGAGAQRLDEMAQAVGDGQIAVISQEALQVRYVLQMAFAFQEDAARRMDHAKGRDIGGFRLPRLDRQDEIRRRGDDLLRIVHPNELAADPLRGHGERHEGLDLGPLSPRVQEADATGSRHRCADRAGRAHPSPTM